MGISYQARSFNFGVAAFAGAAAAFAVFAMPAGLIAHVVAGIAISELVEAGGPTARVGAMGAAGVTAFLFVWLLLRALDRLEARPFADVSESDPDWLVPRLRRSDSHPDAPAPRPIFAGSELGEPAAAAAAEPEPLDLDGYQSGPRPWQRRLVAVDLEQAGQDVAAEGEDGMQEDGAANIPASLIARLSLPEERGRNISSLLERLDTSLAACEWPLPLDLLPKPQPQAHTVDDRLRSALDELQKMASRNG